MSTDVGWSRAAQVEGLRASLEASTAALRESFSSDLAAATDASTAAVAELRREMSEVAQAGENASRQRLDATRRELERLLGHHTTRLEEAENAIENGTIEATALAGEVRRA